MTTETAPDTVPALFPPLQRLTAHPDALVAVPHDPALAWVALGTSDRLLFDTALRAMGRQPEDHWIGTSRLARAKFVVTWDRNESTDFGAPP